MLPAYVDPINVYVENCHTCTAVDLHVHVKGRLLVVKPGAAIYVYRFPPLELDLAIY